MVLGGTLRNKPDAITILKPNFSPISCSSRPVALAVCVADRLRLALVSHAEDDVPVDFNLLYDTPHPQNAVDPTHLMCLMSNGAISVQAIAKDGWG